MSGSNNLSDTVTNYRLSSLAGDVFQPQWCVIHLIHASSQNGEGEKDSVIDDASLPLSVFPSKTRKQRLPALAYPPTPSSQSDSWSGGGAGWASE